MPLIREIICKLLGHKWRFVKGSKMGLEYVRIDLSYCKRCGIWLKDYLG